MGWACAEPGAGRRPPAAYGGGQTGAARFGGGAAGPAARTVAAFPRVFVGYCGLAAFFAGACGPPPACKGRRIPALARRSPLQAAGIRPAGPAAAGGRRGGGLKARPPKTVLRTVCPAGLPRTGFPKAPAPTLRAYPTSCSRMACSSRFSRRETCTCVIPSCRATSVWVLPR